VLVFVERFGEVKERLIHEYAKHILIIQIQLGKIDKALSVNHA
jgi:hypothetical protein